MVSMQNLIYLEVCEIFKESGYELLETECKAVSSKMKSVDKDGYMYFSSATTLKKGSKFDKFNMGNPYSLYNMNVFLKLNKKKSVLLSTEYRGNKAKYLFECECGERYESLFTSVFNGTKDSCDECSKKMSTEKTKHDISYVKDVFNKKGYTLLEDEYTRNNKKMTCVDKDGYMFYANFRMVSTHDKLSVFGNGNIYTLKNLQHYLEINKSKTKVLSEIFHKDNMKLRFKCGMCGDIYEATLASVIHKGKHSCNTCSMKIRNEKIRLNYSDVVNWVNQNTDCELLSNEYYGNNKPLKFKCRCGNKFVTTFAGLKNGKQHCDICGENSRLEKVIESVENVKQYFIDRGYTPTFEEYNGCREGKLSAVNPNGYMIECWLPDFKSGKEPEVFHPSNKYTLQNINRFCELETQGEYECLDNEYINNSSEMNFIHKSCDTIFKAKWVNFQGRNIKAGVKQIGTRCPYCQSQRTESTHATVLKQMFLKLKPEGTILEDPSCINPKTGYPLWTDIVNHEEKIAIEVQSAYHDTDSQIAKDKIKKRFWIKKGYRFYDPDIRDHTILEMVNIFFPNINKIPEWINYNFSNKLDINEAQELLNNGLSIIQVANSMGVKKERVSGAVFYKRLSLPDDYHCRYRNIRPVVKLDLNGRYIDRYNNITEACDKNNLNNSKHLWKCLNGKYLHDNNLRYGYVWLFEDDYIQGNYSVPKKYKFGYDRQIVQLTVSGEVVKFYNSILEAELETGFNKSNIKKNANKNIKTANGFVWVYKEDYDDGNYNLPKSPQLNLKPVLRINPKDISDILTYDSTKDIALEFNVPNWEVRGWIKDCYIRKGFVWMYEDEFSDELYRKKVNRRNNDVVAIIMIDLKTGNIIRFKSRIDATESGLVTKDTLCKCLNGKQKQSKGIKWMYEHNYEEHLKQNKN